MRLCWQHAAVQGHYALLMLVAVCGEGWGGGAGIHHHYQGADTASLLVAVGAGVGKVGPLPKYAPIADTNVKALGSYSLHTCPVGSMEQPRLTPTAQLWSSCLQHAPCLLITLAPLLSLL